MPAEDGQGPRAPLSGSGSDSPKGAAPDSKLNADASGGTSDQDSGDGEQQGSALEDLQQRAEAASTQAARATKDYANLQPEYTRATQERDRFRQEAETLRRTNEDLSKAVQAYQGSAAYDSDEGGELASALGKQVQTMQGQLQQAQGLINRQQSDMRVLAQSTMKALENDQQMATSQKTDSVRQKVRARFGSFEPQIEDFLVQTWQSGDIDAVLELEQVARTAASERASEDTRSNVSRQNEVAAPDIGSRTRGSRAADIDYEEIRKTNQNPADMMSAVLRARYENLRRSSRT